MQNPRRPERQGGFTLLEMLVAITVLALLMIGLTQGVRTGFAFWASQTRRSAEVSELDATARVLRNLLTDIPIRSAASGAGQMAILFEGHSAGLTLVSDLPTGFGDSRRAKIDIALRGEDLVLDWTPHRHEVSSLPQARPAEVRLIHGVKTLEFAYWGDPDGSGGATSWLPEWVSPALPELVRIRLSFGKGDGRRWPDLVAAPQLRTPAG
jgi:general secretion pathway protein J